MNTPDVPGKIKLDTIPYPDARRTLAYICFEISKQLHTEFHSKQAVFNEFARAQFTGIHRHIAPLVEATFGAGAYKRLAAMNAEEESARETLREFKLRRKAKLRSAK